MDIVTTVAYLNRDDSFTDYMGRRHKVDRISYQPDAGGYYVYVVGQKHPEFYLYSRAVTLHVPDSKFKPGDWVVARSGKGEVYLINRVFTDRWGKTYYDFDNGSVDVRKRRRSGWHEMNRADRGYKLVKE